MRKEMPWTLVEKKSQNVKCTKRKSRETTLNAIEEIFKTNKNKSFSLAEIHKLLGEKRKGASIAVAKLHKDNKIKIVRFLENGAKTISPCYQYKNGKDEAVKIIKQSSSQCKRLKLTSICDFVRNSSVLPFNSAIVGKIIKNAEQKHLEAFYVKTNTTYARYYKKEDLESIVNQKPKSTKAVSKKKSTKRRVYIAKEKKPVTLNLFGFKITISK